MIVRGTGFVKGAPDPALKRLEGHLHYLQYRPRAANETPTSRLFFTADADQLASRAALRMLEAHSCPRVRFHKLLFSPSLAEAVPDPHSWLRSIMHDLEQRLGQRLYWVATYHANTRYPHVHVVVGGTGTNNATGKTKMVRLTVADYAFLRETAARYSAASVASHHALAPGNSLPIPLLLPGELQTGSYRILIDLGKKGDKLTPHHVPSAEFMKQFGVKRDEGVALMMEHPTIGGRHRQTRTYGVSPNLAETPRQALARDIRDARNIYRAAGLWNDAARDALREVIYLNKLSFPHLF
jgi:hypothetical protein